MKNWIDVLKFVLPVILTFAMTLGAGGTSACAWSYPPRYWPGWEVLQARAHTYATGQNIGYPTRLRDAKTAAAFRNRDGRVVRVSGASQGGVPCVKGADSYFFYDRPFGLSLCHLTAAWPAYLLPVIQKGSMENPFRAKKESKR